MNTISSLFSSSKSSSKTSSPRSSSSSSLDNTLKSKIRQYTCSAEELFFVRESFLKAVAEDPDAFDVIDVERVQRDEWTVKRFICYKNHSLEEASASLVRSMKWRKEWNASHITETDFPAEFFWTGETHCYGRDKNNTSLVFLRVKYHKCLPDFYDITKRYLIHIMDKMDEEIRQGSNGWALIYDCDGGTIFNNNMEILFFMINTFFENYPLGLNYIGMYELPWVLRAIYHICRGWMPEQFRLLFTILDKQTIHDFVGTEHLPDYLKGTCKLPIRIRKPNNLPMREWSPLNGISEAGMQKFFNHYQKFLDEGDRIEEEEKRRSLEEQESKSHQNEIQSLVENTNSLTVCNNNQEEWVH